MRTPKGVRNMFTTSLRGVIPLSLSAFARHSNSCVGLSYALNPNTKSDKNSLWATAETSALKHQGRNTLVLFFIA